VKYQGGYNDQIVQMPASVYDYVVDIKVSKEREKYWRISDARLIFNLVENLDGGANIVIDLEASQYADVTAFNAMYDLVPRFRTELRRLKRLKTIEWDKDHETYGISQDEWKTTWEFHQSYVNALEILIEYSDIQNLTPSKKYLGHYDDFQHQIERREHNQLECDGSELVDFTSYAIFDVKESNYQSMKWQKREEDNDICLHLDDMLQICSSYRPHYHEFFVHFPAQYIESVKRVIFLGSGDAMLLHEILKYPELEKVVGLEVSHIEIHHVKNFGYLSSLLIICIVGSRHHPY
jgi:hypothetical protein